MITIDHVITAADKAEGGFMLDPEEYPELADHFFAIPESFAAGYEIHVSIAETQAEEDAIQSGRHG
jgi:hypothetical protein